jgi:two-component system, OmpR family, sensor histidine kinase AdeS
LRLRFFITIFSVLIITAISISATHYHFFKAERLRLIELNLEQNANLLKNTNLTFSKSEFSTVGKEVVEKIIGDDKINMILAIYGTKGNVLYKNENAEIFNVPEKLPHNFQEWEDVEIGEYYIKYLTIQDEQQGRFIKVGMILNQSLLRWKYLNRRINVFVFIILFLITIISFSLTFLLFRPVKQLAEGVTLMGEKIERGDFNDLRSWLLILEKKPQDDEFNRLVVSLDKLARKITDTQKQTQKWSALMAHELKTPMTILRNSIDSLVQGLNIDPKRIESVEMELKRLEMIIMDFLEWASLENDASQPILHAIPLGKRCEYLYQLIAKNFPSSTFKFQNQLTEEKRIFCHPIHFDQVLTNLITNALKYGQTAELTVSDSGISIQDDGPGIPDEVMENFGKPFNKFSQGKQEGYGLGLAWVSTIIRKYGWEISIKKNQGTVIDLFFPES